MLVNQVKKCKTYIFSRYFSLFLVHYVVLLCSTVTLLVLQIWCASEGVCMMLNVCHAMITVFNKIWRKPLWSALCMTLWWSCMLSVNCIFVVMNSQEMKRFLGNLNLVVLGEKFVASMPERGLAVSSQPCVRPISNAMQQPALHIMLQCGGGFVPLPS